MICSICRVSFTHTEAEATYKAHFRDYDHIRDEMPPYLFSWTDYCADCAISEAKREHAELEDYCLCPDDDS